MNKIQMALMCGMFYIPSAFASFSLLGKVGPCSDMKFTIQHNLSDLIYERNIQNACQKIPDHDSSDTAMVATKAAKILGVDTPVFEMVSNRGDRNTWYFKIRNSITGKTHVRAVDNPYTSVNFLGHHPQNEDWLAQIIARRFDLDTPMFNLVNDSGTCDDEKMSFKIINSQTGTEYDKTIYKACDVVDPNIVGEDRRHWLAEQVAEYYELIDTTIDSPWFLENDDVVITDDYPVALKYKNSTTGASFGLTSAAEFSNIKQDFYNWGLEINNFNTPYLTGLLGNEFMGRAPNFFLDAYANCDAVYSPQQEEFYTEYSDIVGLSRLINNTDIDNYLLEENKKPGKKNKEMYVVCLQPGQYQRLIINDKRNLIITAPLGGVHIRANWSITNLMDGRDNSATVNINRSENVKLHNLVISNSYLYTKIDSSTSSYAEVSRAVSIYNSDVTISDSYISGRGKQTIHAQFHKDKSCDLDNSASNRVGELICRDKESVCTPEVGVIDLSICSKYQFDAESEFRNRPRKVREYTVKIIDSAVECGYFCINPSAINVQVENTYFKQSLETSGSDSHSLFYTGHDNQRISNITGIIETGASLYSGNNECDRKMELMGENTFRSSNMHNFSFFRAHEKYGDVMLNVYQKPNHIHNDIPHPLCKYYVENNNTCDLFHAYRQVAKLHYDYPACAEGSPYTCSLLPQQDDPLQKVYLRKIDDLLPVVEDALRHINFNVLSSSVSDDTASIVALSMSGTLLNIHINTVIKVVGNGTYVSVVSLKHPDQSFVDDGLNDQFFSYITNRT